MADAIATLLAQTLEEIAAGRRLPEATYRLQFHAGFTFRDARTIAAYLADLGITHCYASPYLKARPGSQHGYDIVDHRLLNPEIGSDEDYAAWVAELEAHGLGQILDTVPNHMGIAGNENVWWNDVLENGPASPFAGYFDISWYASTRPELQGRVLLPTLGDSYGKVLESQQLRLEYAAGAFAVRYFEHSFPVGPCTYGRVLGHRAEELEGLLGADSPPLAEYRSILTAIRNLPSRSEAEPVKIAERHREKEVIKRRLAALTEESAVREFIEQNLTLFNGTPGDPRSFDLLEQLLDDQAYRLCYWRVASDEINYRRFFDVNELAALSMEREEVFAATHELILRLLAQGKLMGLRIDHPDGLYDPLQYLQRLQQHFVLARARWIFESGAAYQGLDWNEIEGPLREQIGQAMSSESTAEPAEAGTPTHYPLYVIAEKILGANEALPENWPIYGTSGYGFLNMLNGLFVDAASAGAFTQLYHAWINDDTTFAEMVYQKKFLILQIAMSSELHTLSHQLDHLAQRNRWSRDFTLHSLRHALREVIACFPVYRSYITDEGIQEAERRHVLRAVGRARARNPALSASIFTFVRDMLLLKYPESASETDQAEQRRFIGKFQQVTAPVMAKGVEDTACYVYGRLLSLNEVGGDPAHFGQSPAALHRYLQERQNRWPWAFSATATHDTKRGEDLRARLNVLSELPDLWREGLVRWSGLNQAHRGEVEEQPAPDANEEYFLYQTLLGAWPLPPCSAEEYTEFVNRIQAYMVKAMHEAKVHTSWINPDPAYDNAVQEFVSRILDPHASGPFLDDFQAFQRRISHYGLFNSLSQTLLKITAPGVVDTYQGTELWDFSLVDPDNRRPVDYERRRQMLRELKTRAAQSGSNLSSLARELVEAKEDGRVKLYVTYRALACRNEHPGLFASGDYLAAETTGTWQDHVFAFARRLGDTWAIVAVPRLLTRVISETDLPLGASVWQDTALLLPGIDRDLRLTNIFTGECTSLVERNGQPSLLASEAFSHFPVALFLADG